MWRFVCMYFVVFVEFSAIVCGRMVGLVMNLEFESCDDVSRK